MSYTLTAELREATDRKLAPLRESKILPGVLYGDGIKENQVVQMGLKDFLTVYEGAGESQVVELKLSDKTHNVIVREVQIDPITRNPIHVDLLSIDINKPIEVDLPLNFTGVAPAVKASGGSLMTQLDSLSVKCLPKNLVKHIDVPLEKLETVDDNILVSDLTIPEGIEVMAGMGEMVATVVPPKIEAAAPTAAEEEAEGQAAGGEEKEKPEEEGKEDAKGDK